MLTTATVDYCCGLVVSGGLDRKEVRQLMPGRPRSALQKCALGCSIAANLALLGYFKYFNFGTDACNGVLASIGLSCWQWRDVARVTLPLGISFYTFQSMSYTIDVYRGHVKATRNPLDFFCYVTLFPQLVAGPIVRYRHLAEQMTGRVCTLERLASGISRFTFGLAKKVLIANTVAATADRIFALPPQELTAASAWLGVIAYTLQIYFDFSGYSDMAIGLGRMLGFDIPENFNYPYIARSLQDFWRRWHISLSTWFRDYLYFPLGGSRCSTLRTYVNLMIVFFLCGLWHGASWNFVLWGLYHGLFLVLERLGVVSFLTRRRVVLCHLYALLVIMTGWVLFRAETLSQAGSMLAAMMGLARGSGSVPSVAAFLANDTRLALLAGVLFSLPVYPWVLRPWRSLAAPAGEPSAWRTLTYQAVRAAATGAALAVCAMALATGTYNPFIYFRF
jgi:alginate O-acetyltransferase complex protein AlgI